MDERFKIAIDKMRARQGDPDAGSADKTSAAARRARNAAIAEIWSRLDEIALDFSHLERERVVTLDKSDTAHIAFDLLRTRVLKLLRRHGWSRIAITSPTKGCGKTFVSCNLALSLSRQSDLRTMLLDLDLRSPRVAQCLGVTRHASIARFLRGEREAEEYFVRVRSNLALGLNADPVRDAAELCNDDRTSEVLSQMSRTLQPDVMIFDLPPALVVDDVIAFLNNVDCVLLVVSSGETTVPQIEECERMLGETGKFLGVLLNKSPIDAHQEYGYDYA